MKPIYTVIEDLFKAMPESTMNLNFVKQRVKRILHKATKRAHEAGRQYEDGDMSCETLDDILKGPKPKCKRCKGTGYYSIASPNACPICLGSGEPKKGFK